METNEKYYCPFAKNECMTYGDYIVHFMKAVHFS